MSTRYPVVAFIALAAVARGAAAQEAEARPERILTGAIVDSMNGHGLGGVVFYLDGRRDEFYSQSDGRFRIIGVHGWDTVLVARRIGYVPNRVHVSNQDPGMISVDLGVVRLRPVATKLDRILVEAEEVNRYPQLEDFYRRKQRGAGGSFITREDIERSSARRVSELLRRTPKVEMNCTDDNFGADNCRAHSQRDRVVRTYQAPPPTRVRGVGGTAVLADTATADFGLDRCEMELYVDGSRSDMKIDDIPVGSIGGIEVYSGISTTPPALGRGLCGVIAIWMRGT